MISDIKQKIRFEEPAKYGIRVHFKNNNVSMYQITKELIHYLELETKPKHHNI